MVTFYPNIQQTTAPSCALDVEILATLDSSFADVRYETPKEGFYIVNALSHSVSSMSKFLQKSFNGSIMGLDIFGAFKKCITKKGISFDKDIQDVAEKLISAFSDKRITSYAVDFGRAYKAVILYASINREWNFRSRCEATDPEDLLVTFSISRCGETIYEGCDDLNDFKTHIDEFFIKLDKNQKKLSEYVYPELKSTASTAVILDIDNWHYGNRVSEGNNA